MGNRRCVCISSAALAARCFTNRPSSIRAANKIMHVRAQQILPPPPHGSSPVILLPNHSAHRLTPMPHIACRAADCPERCPEPTMTFIPNHHQKLYSKSFPTSIIRSAPLPAADTAGSYPPARPACVMSTPNYSSQSDYRMPHLLALHSTALVSPTSACTRSRYLQQA